MKKHFCFILFVLCLFSCRTNYYPTNKNFYKPANAAYYLCYIDSEPKIKSLTTIDTIVIQRLRYRLHKEISNYEMLVFNVRAVDYFMTEKNIAERQRISEATGQEKTPNREFYLNSFNEFYFLVDKNRKKDIKSKKTLLNAYKNKNLIIIEQGSFIMQHDSSKLMISSQIFELNNHTRFDHLIKIE